MKKKRKRAGAKAKSVTPSFAKSATVSTSRPLPLLPALNVARLLALVGA
jgi:hypothetical protein